MKAWSQKCWAWSIGGLSLHRYTRNGWPPNIIATGFTKDQYAAVVDETLGMDDFIRRNAEIMDRYDPEVQVGIYVDEWGTLYKATEGSPEGYLEQQNSHRDAHSGCLEFQHLCTSCRTGLRCKYSPQMINVLQAMIHTDQEKMVLTPTYHAFRMYVPFQNATRIPIEFDAGTYHQGDITLPRVDAIAAKDGQGRIIVAITNVDLKNEVTIKLSLAGQSLANVKGESPYATEIDAINTFENPDTVSPETLNMDNSGSRASCI